MSVLPDCVSVHHVCIWYLQRPEETVDPLEYGVTEGCELPCPCYSGSQPVKSSQCSGTPSHLSSPRLTCISTKVI